jgi:phosphoserine aminotransferase
MPDNLVFEWMIYALCAVAVITPILWLLLNRENPFIYGAVFRGDTNTPSLPCVEDVLDSLNWAESVGGREGLIARSEGNLEAVTTWAEATPWVVRSDLEAFFPWLEWAYAQVAE